jgi:RNA polymerase sigma factor (sigma-70 family)
MRTRCHSTAFAVSELPPNRKEGPTVLSRSALEAAIAPVDHPRQDPSDQPVSELLRRAAQRDLAAWDVLVSRFGRLVIRVGRRVGLNDADAADVAQLTWIRLLEHARQIREPERLPAWLTSTARREAIRVAIDAKRYVLYADPTTENGVERRGSVSDVYPVDGDYGPEIEEALAQLPTRYQQLLRILTADDCPSYAEIANRMQMPIGSIGPMRMRALEMLRRALGFDRVARGRAVL